MRGTLKAVEELKLLVQACQHLVQIAVAQRARVLLVSRPLGQLARVDTGQQLADRAAQRER